MKIIKKLDGKWQGCYRLPNQEAVEFVGKVPGCAHTDLLSNGLIKNPLADYWSEKCLFIEDAVFEYTTKFIFEDQTEGMRLHFDCLDTFCDVFLNGQLLGFCDDMFLPWDFDVSEQLCVGENKLHIRFYPPKEQVKDRPEHPAAFTTERVHIRRMQCTFGWDWVARFVTMGIEGSVCLYRYDETEISHVSIATTALDSYGAEVDFKVEFSKVGEHTTLVWSILSPDRREIWKQRRAIAEDVIHQTVSVNMPLLWWPNGYGEQPLYLLRMKILDKDGQVLQKKDTAFGIRTIRILESRDEKDSDNYRISKDLQKIPHISQMDQNEEYYGFQVLVNGQLVYCKGADWVPCEPFVSSVTKEKYNALLQLAVEANMNILRVWGGGVIESDHFYEECDRLGILVIQDFLMACAEYPVEDADFMDKLRREADVAVKRIQHHPSLAWWTGDNENSENGHLELWDYRGRKAAHQALEPIVRGLDPYRRFLPSSPYGGKPFKSVTSGNAHNTAQLMWMYEQFRDSDMTDYHKILSAGLSRFNSEIAVFEAPPMSSMKRFLSKEYLYDEACLEFHTKNNPVGILETFTLYQGHRTFAEKLLGNFQSDEDRLLKMRCIQYEWVRYMAELYRRNKGYTGGILFWMYNDCWPSDSWSVVDYYGNPKAGWYAMKNAFRSTIGSIHKEKDEFVVTVVNDGMEDVNGIVKITHLNTCLDVPKQQEEVSFVCNRNEKTEVFKCNWSLSERQELLMLEVFARGIERPYRTIYFPKRIADLLPAVDTERAKVYIMERGDDFITLCAKNYTHMVNLDGDYIFEDNYFMMLPGEIRKIHFRRTRQAASSEIMLYTL